jgi:mono/diheme cytochrome c family protein
MVYRASLLLAVVFAAFVCVAEAEAMKSSIANGRAIFQTGRDLHGTPIRATRPPLRPSCAACHGMNGAGGVHVGGAVSADLRHASLVTHMKHPYTLALIERAIAKGIDSDGQSLSPVMPRWQMSAADLHDVSEYVFTQLK